MTAPPRTSPRPLAIAICGALSLVHPIDVHAGGAPRPGPPAAFEVDTTVARAALRGEAPPDGACARAVRQRFIEKGWDPSDWTQAITGGEIAADSPYHARVSAHRARPDPSVTLDALTGRSPELAAEAVDVVETYLPAPLRPGFSVCISALAPSDAFVILDHAGEPTLVIDLSAIPDDDVDLGLRVGLWHELWHVGFHQSTAGARGWPAATNPTEQLADTLIDEGIAHYVGLLAYGGTPTLRDTTRAQIAENASRHEARFIDEWEWFSSAPSGAEVDRRREEAVTGAFWDKWGAVTVMSWTDAAVHEAGAPALRASLRAGREATWERLAPEGHPSREARLADPLLGLPFAVDLDPEGMVVIEAPARLRRVRVEGPDCVQVHRFADRRRVALTGQGPCEAAVVAEFADADAMRVEVSVSPPDGQISGGDWVQLEPGGMVVIGSPLPIDELFGADDAVFDLVLLDEQYVAVRGLRPGASSFVLLMDGQEPVQYGVVVEARAAGDLGDERLVIGETRRLHPDGALRAWVGGDDAVLAVRRCGADLCVTGRREGHTDVIALPEVGDPQRWLVEVAPR